MPTLHRAPWRRTKIVCTLGPACADAKVLERMIHAGMDVARLNFSHGNYDSHAQLLRALRAAASRAGRTVGVLQDLCGPKIRVGEFSGGFIEIHAQQEVLFTAGSGKAHAPVGALPVEYAGLARDVKPGDRILFDDGALEARVRSTSRGLVRVRFTRGGRLKSRKGMNLPGVKVSSPSVTPKDLRDLEWGLAHGVDFVALSFVRGPEDLEKVRSRLTREASPPLLISKIEKPEAVERLEEIVRASDGVMVARGDLGVELDFEKVPMIQKRLIRLANERDIPAITATQMLESMTQSPRPTRAEVSDVSNAILDGSDAVMLSGETASGQYPVEAVTAMSAIAVEAERYLLEEHRAYAAPLRETPAAGLHDALALGVERIARSLEVHAIVIATRSGETARYLASSRPRVPVLGLSPHPRALRRMALFWGITPIPCRTYRRPAELIRQAEQVALQQGLIQPGQTLIVAVGREAPGSFSGRIHLQQL